MGSKIEYVIKTSGAAFNNILAPEYRRSAMRLADLELPGAFIDCELPGSDLGFLAVLTGELTWASLSLNYALLDSDKHKAETVATVEAWENILKALLPATPIIRVHGGLLEKWQALQPDDWFNNAAKFDDLCTWLEGDDPSDWRRVQ